jgi:hypothetical protein
MAGPQVSAQQKARGETPGRGGTDALVWTRGEQVRLDQLESRLKCPRCGQRRVTVMFEIQNRPQALER